MDIKKEGIKILAGVGLVLVLYWAILFFKLNLWQIWGLLMCVQVVLMLYFKTFKWKSVFKSAITIAILLLLLRFLAGFGAWGYILTVILIVAFILYRRWEKYLGVKHHIESMIWGKPLKEFKTGKDIPRFKFSGNK